MHNLKRDLNQNWDQPVPDVGHLLTMGMIPNFYRCRRWVQNCRRADLLNADTVYLNKNCRLCDLHFLPSQFMNEKRDSLIWNAVPTVFNEKMCQSDIPNPNIRKPPRDRSQLTKVEHAQAELPLPVAVVDISVVNGYICYIL